MAKHHPPKTEVETEARIAALLRRAVRRNDHHLRAAASSGGPVSDAAYAFRSSIDKAGVVSLDDYLAKIVQRGRFLLGRGPFRNALIVSFIYLDRYARMNPDLPINSQNVRGLLLPAVLLAMKFLHNRRSATQEFAAAGWVGVPEMNRLERNLLSALDYKIFVSEKDFVLYSQKIESSAYGVREEGRGGQMDDPGHPLLPLPMTKTKQETARPEEPPPIDIEALRQAAKNLPRDDEDDWLRPRDNSHAHRPRRDPPEVKAWPFIDPIILSILHPYAEQQKAQ